ncbi:hypothetical protein [Hydrogenophaga luteola]|uniref:Uncharacterized protein n=1 Tax=Hydrogenophaga luteola TaxID=1591122 RepID=A0ABV7W9E4_9BURK
MSQAEIKELKEHLQEQTAFTASACLMIGAIASVLTDEQFADVFERYEEAALTHRTNVANSPRKNAKQWATAMEEAQQALLVQTIGIREMNRHAAR